MRVPILLLFACSLAGCGPASGIVTTPHRSGEDAPPRCGNGVVDEGELCDPQVAWARACPEPFGICWVCSPACNARVLSSSDELAGVVVEPFCEETGPSGTITRTYDEHGHLTQSHQRLSEVAIVWRFERDARGRTIAEHSRIGAEPEDHLFREHDETGERRAYSDGDLDGVPEREWHFEREGDGRVRRVWSARGDGPIESDRRYTYDAEGRVTADVEIFPDVSWHSAYVFLYDELGREIYSADSGEGTTLPRSECRTRWHGAGSTAVCVRRDPTTGAVTTSRTHDDGDRIESLVEHPNGLREHSITELTRDERGLVVREIERADDGSVLRSEQHEHDEHGVRVRSVASGDPERTTQRDLRCLADAIGRAPWRGFEPRARVEAPQRAQARDCAPCASAPQQR